MFSVFFFLLFFTSCAEKDIITKHLIGIWKDKEVHYLNYVLDNGELTPISFSNIQYVFSSSGEYMVLNKAPFDLPEDGSFSLNFESSKIDFSPDFSSYSNPSFFLDNIYEWKIEQIDETSLEIVFTYMDLDSIGGNEPIQYSKRRYFSKQ